MFSLCEMFFFFSFDPVSASPSEASTELWTRRLQGQRLSPDQATPAEHLGLATAHSGKKNTTHIASTIVPSSSGAEQPHPGRWLLSQPRSPFVTTRGCASFVQRWGQGQGSGMRGQQGWSCRLSKLSSAGTSPLISDSAWHQGWEKAD